MRMLRLIFSPPTRADDSEHAQNTHLLHWMLLAGLLAAVVLGLINIGEADRREVIAFCLLGAACLAGLFLNGTGRYGAAAWLFCVSVLATLDYILFDAGGLHDTGVTAFPIFLLCATLLLGRRALWLATALSLVSVAVLYLLQLTRVYKPLVLATPLTVLVLSIIIVIFSLIMASVRNAWDTHLTLLRESYDLTLQGWSKALEYRDGETEGHCQRVTQLCADLARRLGRSEDEIADIQRGAYLHDTPALHPRERRGGRPAGAESARWSFLTGCCINPVPWTTKSGRSCGNTRYWQHACWPAFPSCARR